MNHVKEQLHVPAFPTGGVGGSEEMPRNAQDGITSEHAPCVHLPRALLLFFGLNGFTLSLEALGLMYVINTRVEMPIPYLPTYGAIAFLPYSFKPIYGYLSQGVTSRFHLFTLLLFANGLTVLSTVFIPKGGVFIACLVAFLRGVTDSWAELCLGLTLIDCARAQSMSGGLSFDSLASTYQAHAATARNLGSFLAYGCTFVMFTGRQLLHTRTQEELSSADANILLISTAALQLFGVVAACCQFSGFNAAVDPGQGFTLLEQDADQGDPEEEVIADEASSLKDDEKSDASYSSANDESSLGAPSPVTHRTPTSLCRYNYAMVILIQISVLILAMKGPITTVSSHLLWKVSLVSCLLATAVVGLASLHGKLWAASHSVGLYLILKHALPSNSMILGAYFYSLFKSSPAFLQVLALLGSGVTTVSSWSYGRYMSKYNSGGRFLMLIAGTTIIAGIASLGNVIVFRHSQSEYLVWIVVLVKSLETFFREWQFLPNIVLASTSLSLADHQTPDPLLPTDHSHLGERTNDNVGVEYGTLISCIDFGDQLGSLVMGPLVAIFGISRESNFASLDRLIIVCFFFDILSLLLLALLKHKR
jgi:hypothetical protein